MILIADDNEDLRNRVLTAEEYSALLKHCPDWLRRAVAFSWETSLSRSDLFNLTWSEIDLAESIIELKHGRAKTGKPQIIPIYTPELKALISELQAERRKTPNVGNLVLTENGQPLDKLKFEYHFRRAVRLAGIKNFTLHDAMRLQPDWREKTFQPPPRCWCLVIHR